MAASVRFTAKVDDVGRGRAVIRLPFDPDAVWGPKRQHHVRGTVAGNRVRGPLRLASKQWTLVIGAAWLRDNPLPIGAAVKVVLEAEGPQNADLTPGPRCRPPVLPRSCCLLRWASNLLSQGVPAMDRRGFPSARDPRPTCAGTGRLPRRGPEGEASLNQRDRASADSVARVFTNDAGARFDVSRVARPAR